MNYQEKWHRLKEFLQNLVGVGVMLILFIPLMYSYQFFNKKPSFDELTEQSFILNLSPHLYDIPGKNRIDKQCRFFIKNHMAKFVSPVFSDSSIVMVRKELQKGDTVFAQIRKENIEHFDTIGKEIVFESLSSKNKNFYALNNLDNNRKESIWNSAIILFSVGIIFIIVDLLFWNWN